MDRPGPRMKPPRGRLVHRWAHGAAWHEGVIHIRLPHVARSPNLYPLLVEPEAMPPERAEIGGQDHGHLSAQSVTNQRAVARTTDKRFNGGGRKCNDALDTLCPVLPLFKERLATCCGRSRQLVPRRQRHT